MTKIHRSAAYRRMLTPTNQVGLVHACCSHRQGSNTRQAHLGVSLAVAEAVRHGRRDVVDEEAAEYLYRREPSPRPLLPAGADTDHLSDFGDEPFKPNACESRSRRERLGGMSRSSLHTLAMSHPNQNGSIIWHHSCQARPLL